MKHETNLLCRRGIRACAFASGHAPNSASSAVAPRRLCAQPRARISAAGAQKRARRIQLSACDMDPRLRAPALKGDVEALTTALNAGARPKQAR